ncbi:hypothetical protein ASD56_08365 [Microbacterium sp. Root166]|uniref:hypothetical protein n=1 Tax=Microbacterium sp. Root166 TaxID=1736478 RepID=UPI0006F81627|nr:hypothetical protein [Microbacterium sp. Root166]KQZ84033.1 hypothetical protein ASD56_08365 [Microbacterium sp. Root166]
MARNDVLAWVESPLQLVGAAEWADAHGTTVPVAGRLTPQMSATADELLARGARFGDLEPYLGIPFSLLARHGHWLVGDGFSGQFRAAASLLRPHRVTFLDDGAQTIAYADALLERRPYARPGVMERGLTTRIAPLVRATVLHRAAQGRADLFTAFDLGAERADALADRGFGIRRHSFEWTRRTAPAVADPGGRVILGSAQPVDGRLSLAAYLDWVRDAAAAAPATYLPHRREPAAQLAAVAAIRGITVRRTDLPVELVLAGATGPLEIRTLASSTTTTLPLVLRGSGVDIRAGRRSTGVREPA